MVLGCLLSSYSVNQPQVNAQQNKSIIVGSFKHLFQSQVKALWLTTQKSEYDKLKLVSIMFLCHLDFVNMLEM